MTGFNRREIVFAAAVSAATGPAQARLPGRKRQSGFLWGAATAAHQIEGNNTNSDYWVMEHVPGTYFKEPSGDACDSFNRWREDIAMLKLGGMNAYRFSIEWARIEPAPGEYSQAMLDYYRRICIALREAGITPIVTLHHFTSPAWIAGLGGWEDRQVIDHFVRYVERSVRALGDVVDWFCTMNEPNAQVTSKVLQKVPWAIEPTLRAKAAQRIGADQFHMYFLGDSYTVRDICLAAHAKSRDAIKAIAPAAKVGLTLALQQLTAGPGGEAYYKRIFAEAREPFYEAARGDDFIGVQTYNKFETGPDGYAPWPTDGMRDMFDLPTPPGALAAAVREAWKYAKVPVMISEHGNNTNDDAQRIRHLRASLEGVVRAISDGVPVLGYLHWSLLDNFEWSSGYRPRFGLVAVDRKTFKRTPKPSLTAFRTLVGEMRSRHRWA